MIVRSIDRDMFVLVLVEGGHERFEIFLTAYFAHVLGREVGMESGTVPVAENRFAVQLDVNFIVFTEARQQEAGYPYLICGRLRAFAEDLEFPLAFRHFGVDAFMVDSGCETKIEVRVDDFAGDGTHVSVADTGVVFTLRIGKAIGREAERTAVFPQEILLLKAEPSIRII